MWVDLPGALQLGGETIHLVLAELRASQVFKLPGPDVAPPSRRRVHSLPFGVTAVRAIFVRDFCARPRRAASRRVGWSGCCEART